MDDATRTYVSRKVEAILVGFSTTFGNDANGGMIRSIVTFWRIYFTRAFVGVRLERGTNEVARLYFEIISAGKA